jgi:allantoinase
VTVSDDARKEALDYYRPWPYDQRPKIEWPNGAKIAFWVAPNIEVYELNPPANAFRTPWPQPFPAVPGYSIRDYGNRVGHMRQMKVLDKYGIRGSISLSSALIDHHPEIIELCKERNWEFFSHGIYNTRYTYGLDEAQEKALIQDSIDSIRNATGEAPVGYLAPALSHSEITVDLWQEAGGTYTCDLFHDDQPTPVKVRSGKPFVSIPYSLELNDTIAYVVNKIEPRRYGQMIKDAFDRLYAEGDQSGTVMCIPTHNYQVSTPHRLKAFEEALEYITGHSDVWVTTGREIADYYLENYYDTALASIDAVNGGAA